jgi:hypothetical protein
MHLLAAGCIHHSCQAGLLLLLLSSIWQAVSGWSRSSSRCRCYWLPTPWGCHWLLIVGHTKLVLERISISIRSSIVAAAAAAADRPNGRVTQAGS